VGYLETVTSQASDEWPTPGWLVQQCRDEFTEHGFDLDPAATEGTGQAPTFFTIYDDGLGQPWKGRVWMNPPYSQVGAWMAKAASEVAIGNAELVVCLVPARVDARWYRAASAVASVVRILPQRVKFGGCKDSAPFPSAIIVFGTDGRRHGTLPRRCRQCSGYWFPVRSTGAYCSTACRMKAHRYAKRGVSVT
jgi:phage N-6-adenine-methyltransferase